MKKIALIRATTICYVDAAAVVVVVVAVALALSFFILV